MFYSDFGLFYQVPKNSGILYPVTQTIDTYVYNALMNQNNPGMSAAAGFIQAIVGCVLVVACLLYTSCSICEISVYLGFSSVSYFSRCFKKRKGESPKEYRKQNHFADFTFEQYQE